jgi:hypothetical protein
MTPSAHDKCLACDCTCRTISYCSGLFTMTLNLLWLLPFYNVGGTRNGWFTIFVDLYVLHKPSLHISNAEPVSACVYRPVRAYHLATYCYSLFHI